MEHSPKPPLRQPISAAELEARGFGRGQKPAREPRPIGDDELLDLLDEAGWDMVEGHGPYLSVAYDKGYVSIFRFFDFAEASKAYRFALGWFDHAEFLVATGDYAQRRHEGCSSWCLPPSDRRHKAWGGRYDPKRRVKFFAKKWREVDPDDPDAIDRERGKILKRCEGCADCRREAGEQHLAKLRRQHERERPGHLLSMPMDAA